MAEQSYMDRCSIVDSPASKRSLALEYPRGQHLSKIRAGESLGDHSIPQVTYVSMVFAKRGGGSNGLEL